ncbi:MAG: helix-turn-helix transcriptional regulator [Clostridiaceae bacterium]|nr:helix-turn-helix transcriptional regulator [Clostridiaceae bacterium]
MFIFIYKGVSPLSENKPKKDCCFASEGIEKVAKMLSPDEELMPLAEFFRIFGDFTRLKIIQALSAHELCVCHLAEIVNVSQSAVSHQLRLLKQYRLVKVRRAGKEKLYSLDDEHIMEIFNTGLMHLAEKKG